MSISRYCSDCKLGGIIWETCQLQLLPHQELGVLCCCADYNGNDVETIFTPNYQDCIINCQRDQRCFAFSWAGGTCWKKSARGTAVNKKDGAVSGLVVRSYESSSGVCAGLSCTAVSSLCKTECGTTVVKHLLWHGGCSSLETMRNKSKTSVVTLALLQPEQTALTSDILRHYLAHHVLAVSQRLPSRCQCTVRVSVP